MPSEDHSEYIRQIVDAAPPLTPEQRARLQVLLSPVVVDPRTEDATTDGNTVEFRFQATSGQQKKA